MNENIFDKQEQRISKLEKENENLKELIAKLHSNYLQLKSEIKILKAHKQVSGT